MKTIAFYNNVHSSALWMQLAGPLQADGIDLVAFGYGSQDDLCLRIGKGEIDILITDVSREMPGFENLCRSLLDVKTRVALNRQLPEEFSTVPADELEEVRKYFSVLSKQNYLNGVRRIAGLDFEPCAPVRTFGIYHPEAPGFFEEILAYKAWLQERKIWDMSAPVTGVIMPYSLLAEGNTSDIDALLAKLEECGVIACCVFCDTLTEKSANPEAQYPWCRYFREPELPPDIILSFLMGRLLVSVGERALLREINVPVMQLMRNYTLSPEEWLNDPVGISAMSLTHSLVQPEMFGVIDPTMVSATCQGSGGTGDGSVAVPIEERVVMVARRVRRWAELRRKPVAEKRLAIVLHNNPCKGVENTVGMAVGLDTFESLVSFLRDLKTAGYTVGDIPATGRELLDMIQERKSMDEFRWTTVDEVVRKGGGLHFMNQDEYKAFFDTLDTTVQDKVNSDWGMFPGQGMVWKKDGEDVLVITGICFGNIQIMSQPKRGCYGSRCDGEVCRILHDPEISPPHHWLATYYHIQRHADAVIHFGASGALEYLPGKRAALSQRCFSDISLGDLPNFYPYVMDVAGEGMVAKRRGRAVIIDHLTPAYRPSAMSDDLLLFEDYLTQYKRAVDGNDHSRRQALLHSMRDVAVKLKFIDVDDDAGQLEENIERFSRQIAGMKRSMVPDGLHVFGRRPDLDTMCAMIASALDRAGDGILSQNELASRHPVQEGDLFEKAAGIIRAVLEDNDDAGSLQKVVEGLPESFRSWCKKMADSLARAEDESRNLLRALDGEYIDAGLSGSIASGKADVLPTGRNFYSADIMTLPSEAAWKIGCSLADKLLEKFYLEEGHFPESIGLSLWSSDAFKSDGELLSQIFWLLGVLPVRKPNGRISGVKAAALDELTVHVEGVQKERPRIDVTIETSGIVRDMVPHFIALLDKAVATVSNLDESFERNKVRKHTEEQFEVLKQEMADQLNETEIRRLALYRVFSSAPGTYSSGVGLAIDASAWEDDGDLAEAYINQSGYAYGATGRDFGVKAQDIFAGQLSRVDVSCMKQTSAEYDALDCGCYASFAGGMATASTALSGRKTKMYWVDATVPGETGIRDFKEEIERSARSKLLNERWIESMKEHGFQGAQAIAGRINSLFKWSVTTQEVEKWLFDSVVETYVQDEKNREWIRENNPYALEEITRRLLEAEARGLWKASGALLDEVRSAALALEGDLEEKIGDVDEAYQGSRIDVYTCDKVKKWAFDWKIDRGQPDNRQAAVR